MFQLLLFIWAFSLLVFGRPLCELVPPKNVQAVANTTSQGSTEVVATGWYPGWHGAEYPPDKISWGKYSIVTYAFATTTPNPSVISLADSDKTLLTTFVDAARKNGVNASLSIGGWTGSRYFSTAVATADNRTAFTKAIVDLITTYSLDGIDFDWEYPNHQGIGCNTISPDDSANFLLFLQQLRKDPAAINITISAAVGLAPFASSSGTPMTDVSGFSKVIDFIEIMNYDVWGSWSTTGVGPNAPLHDSCATTKAGSAESAVTAWTGAGFPASQIALGVPAYGHSFHVASTAAMSGNNSLAAYPPFDKSLQPPGDKWDGAAGSDECGNLVSVGGIFDFWGLVDAGFLTSNGTAASGMEYRFDNCSKTPFVYNPTSQVMISYDDAQSFAAKGDYINSAGLKGYAVWHIAGDYNDILVDSLHSSIGIESVC